MWIRHWLGAVSVVDCQCCFIEVVQFTVVMSTNPLEVSNKRSHLPSVNGWVEVRALLYLNSAGSGCILVAWIWE